MEQYLSIAKEIFEQGVVKSSGREGMPDTISRFGVMRRFNLQDGFPLLTTKKVSFKNILVELLWFLKGDTNIRFLLDNNCNIWTDDAYRWYTTKFKQNIDKTKDNYSILSKEEFAASIKNGSNTERHPFIPDYKLGDLGDVYGSQWRKWKKGINPKDLHNNEFLSELLNRAKSGRLEDHQQKDLAKWIETYILGDASGSVDQLMEIISNLRKNPFGRRNIMTAWNPAELADMALPPCHLLSHFNCRPATIEERIEYANKIGYIEWKHMDGVSDEGRKQMSLAFDREGIPKVMLDCLLYQRSCDSFLGVPYNIASYALLTEVIAKMTGLIAGEFIWVGGDTHFYDNHKEAVNIQLERSPKPLPILEISDRVSNLKDPKDITLEDFEAIGYDPHPAIKAILSTGTA